jgi:hypothetical protein
LSRSRNEHDILAIIPARGGSKGVPRKNIRILGDRPLIAYSIVMALGVEGIGRVVVSTEDDEIACVAREWGAEVPFLRPAAMASDTAVVGQACSYTLRRLKDEQGYLPESWCILFPTQPFRKKETISKLVNKLQLGHQRVNAYTKVTLNESTFYYPGKDYKLYSLPNAWSRLIGGECWYPSGYFVGSRSIPAHLSLGEYIFHLENPVEMLDIDYIHDFYLAEEILREGLYRPE